MRPASRLDAGAAASTGPATLSRPTASIHDDEALSRALVSGDAHAFRVLVERETSRVFRVCYRVLGRVDEAEDATQETFVLAYRALGTYRGDGHPAAWVMRIAIREAWRRAAARSKRRSLTAELDEVAGRLPSGAPGPAAEALLSEERDAVRRAVSGMREPYREVIALRFFADLSILEICAATGRPEGTVKAQIHRGLKHLREILTEGAP